MENYKTIAIGLLIGVIVLFLCCVVLFILLYQAKSDNATLEYQNACITSDNSQEMTFKTIDDDLQKIFKVLSNKCENCKIKKQ